MPANRPGYGRFSATQLKTLQEVITLAVFVGFAIFVLGERPKLNHLVAFGLLVGAVYMAFRG